MNPEEQGAKQNTIITQESYNRRQPWVLQKPPKVTSSSKRRRHDTSQQDAKSIRLKFKRQLTIINPKVNLILLAVFVFVGLLAVITVIVQ